jgi:predicted MFS family arabinose efflux permease
MTTGQMLMLLRRKPNFGMLFLGLLVSRVGDYFNLVAISWLLLEKAGPRALGIFLLVQGLSGALSGPLAGVLLERYGLRKMVVLDNIARAGVAGTIPLLLSVGIFSVGYLYLVAAISGLLSTLTELGQNIVIPLLVDEPEVVGATTLMSAIWDVSAWIGPAAAGVVVELAGISAALIVDVASFLVMAATAAALPRRLPVSDLASHGRSVLLRGFVAVFRMRAVVVITATLFGLLMLTGALEVYYPVFSRSIVHIGAGGYGALMSLAGLGGLIGTLILTPLLSRWRPRLAIAFPLGARLAIVALVAFTGNLGLAIGLILCGSCLDGPLYALLRSGLQRQVPISQRSQVFATVSVVTSAGFPLGAAGAGLLIATYGTRATLLLVSALLAPLAVLIGCARVVDTPPAAFVGAASAGASGAGR